MCTKLKKATVGSGIENISDFAFSNNYALETLTLPATIKSIGRRAFMADPLKEIYYGGTEKEWSAIEINNYGNDNGALFGAAMYYQSN